MPLPPHTPSTERTNQRHAPAADDGAPDANSAQVQPLLVRPPRVLQRRLIQPLPLGEPGPVPTRSRGGRLSVERAGGRLSVERGGRAAYRRARSCSAADSRCPALQSASRSRTWAWREADRHGVPATARHHTSHHRAWQCAQEWPAARGSRASPVVLAGDHAPRS